MGYQSDYARTVADIYSQLGQGQAQARLQQGSAWANAFGQIGQTIAAIPGQMAQQKKDALEEERLKQQGELTDIQMELARKNLAAANVETAEKQAIDQLYSASVGADGAFDPQLFQKNAAEVGMSYLTAPTLEANNKSLLVAEQLKEAQLRGKISEQQVISFQKAALAPYAIQMIENEFAPQAVMASFAKMKVDGIPVDTINKYRMMAATSPDTFISSVMGLAPKREEPEAFNQNPGDLRREPMRDRFGRLMYDEKGQPRYNEFPGPEKAQSFKNVPISVGGKTLMANFDEAAGKYFKAGTVPPEEITGDIQPVKSAAVNVNTGSEPVAPPSDVSSQDIMSQAGLSRMGYLSLTNPTSMPKDQATRTRAATEVAAWARLKGIDTSTFETKFKAFNKVLSNNIMRLNTVQNIELDLQGTIQNLQTAATEAGMTDVTAVNAMKLWLAGNLNDPSAINYATILEALVSDIARYNSSSSSPDGDRNPLDADMTAARNLLKRGISSGGLAGVLKAVNVSVANMDRVNKTAVTRAEKAVWTLFGVGDKYQPKTNDPMEIRR